MWFGCSLAKKLNSTASRRTNRQRSNDAEQDIKICLFINADASYYTTV